jgi:hypothetical protein
MKWGSSVGIATGYGLNDRGSSPGRGWEFFLRHFVQTGSGPTQPSIQRVRRAFSSGLKWPGRGADRSPPSSAEVKNAWIYACAPHKSSWRGT